MILLSIVGFGFQVRSTQWCVQNAFKHAFMVKSKMTAIDLQV